MPLFCFLSTHLLMSPDHMVTMSNASLRPVALWSPCNVQESREPSFLSSVPEHYEGPKFLLLAFHNTFWKVWFKSPPCLIYFLLYQHCWRSQIWKGGGEAVEGWQSGWLTSDPSLTLLPVFRAGWAVPTSPRSFQVTTWRVHGADQGGHCFPKLQPSTGWGEGVYYLRRFSDVWGDRKKAGFPCLQCEAALELFTVLNCQKR